MTKPLTREQKIWATKVARHGPTGHSKPFPKKPIMERFFNFVMFEPNTGCWLWSGNHSQDGYGYFSVTCKKMKVAHVFLYERENGTIPDGLELDHLCKVRCCVNPMHLEAVTHAENVKRGDVGKRNREKTHCKKGHPYSGYNLSIAKDGSRVCKTCRRNDMRAYRERKKGNTK